MQSEANRNDSPLAVLQRAGIKRDGRWLVRDIDLEVKKGEIVTLIGPNGSGKSTTAKLALGGLVPTQGTAHQRADLNVGYVPQKLTIDWTMPLLVDRFMNLTGKVAANRAEWALESAGVAHLKRANVRHLSGGEFQRVLMARAIARRPNLLVLDEPVQGVDFSGETAIYELIVSMRDKLDCGILLISHDLHVVMAATDRVVCLNGHVCCQGTPVTVLKDPAFQNLFGQREAGRLAVYRHRHDHRHAPDGSLLDEAEP